MKQRDQYNPKKEKVYKGRSIKEHREHDARKAIEQRDAISGARQTHEFSRTQQQTNKRKIPKNLKHVESVIKKRVDLDREIGKKRKNNNQSYAPEPEIYVPVDKNQKKKNKKSRSKSHESRDRQPKSGEQSMDNSMTQQLPNAEEQTPAQKYSGRPQHTEDSSYPSVTQASAPPPDYYERQPASQNYRVEQQQYNAQNESGVNQSNTSYRPSSLNGPQNNAVDITERFMNSPMMTQFSDTSDPQKRPQYQAQGNQFLLLKYISIDANPRPQEYSYNHSCNHGYNNSSSYSHYQQQNRSDESIYGQQNQYDAQPGGTVQGANHSRFYEDQVLFKSNGFEANGTSTGGKVNDSALPQSPTIYERNKDHNPNDSKLAGTANFERPREYDVKYSDYRRTNQGYPADRPDQGPDTYNPFKSHEYSRVNDSNETAPFAYQPRSQQYEQPQNEGGSYKYLPKWENPENRASYNAVSDQMYSSYGYTPGAGHGQPGPEPPKYLQPQEESKYASQERKFILAISQHIHYRKPNVRRRLRV